MNMKGEQSDFNKEIAARLTYREFLSDSFGIPNDKKFHYGTP